MLPISIPSADPLQLSSANWRGLAAIAATDSEVMDDVVHRPSLAAILPHQGGCVSLAASPGQLPHSIMPVLVSSTNHPLVSDSCGSSDVSSSAPAGCPPWGTPGDGAHMLTPAPVEFAAGANRAHRRSIDEASTSYSGEDDLGGSSGRRQLPGGSNCFTIPSQRLSTSGSNFTAALRACVEKWAAYRGALQLAPRGSSFESQSQSVYSPAELLRHQGKGADQQTADHQDQLDRLSVVASHLIGLLNDFEMAAFSACVAQAEVDTGTSSLPTSFQHAAAAVTRRSSIPSGSSGTRRRQRASASGFAVGSSGNVSLPPATVESAQVLNSDPLQLMVTSPANENLLERSIEFFGSANYTPSLIGIGAVDTMASEAGFAGPLVSTVLPRVQRLQMVEDGGFEMINEYIVLDELGRGTSGVVYLAMHESSGEAVAIKAMMKAKAKKLLPSRTNSIVRNGGYHLTQQQQQQHGRAILHAGAGLLAAVTQFSNRRPSDDCDLGSMCSLSRPSPSHDNSKGQRALQQCGDATPTHSILSAEFDDDRRRSSVTSTASRHVAAGNVTASSQQQQQQQLPIEREIWIMKHISHPNLVKLLQVIDDDEDHMIYLVLEYCAHGSVADAKVVATHDPPPVRPALTQQTQAPSVSSPTFSDDTIRQRTLGDPLSQTMVPGTQVQAESISDSLSTAIPKSLLLMHRAGDMPQIDPHDLLMDIGTNVASTKPTPVAMPDPVPAAPVTVRGIIRPLPRLIRFAVDIAKGLRYLHRCNIVHRDIKPDNIMIADGDVVKITDFGVSGRLLSSRVDLKRLAGTPAFLAPEVVNGSPATKSSDVWAFGVTLYTMMFGQLPFVGRTLPDQLSAIVNEDVTFPALSEIPCVSETDGGPLLPETYEIWKNIVRGLLQKSPAQRSTLRQFLRHPFAAAATSPRSGGRTFMRSATTDKTNVSPTKASSKQQVFAVKSSKEHHDDAFYKSDSSEFEADSRRGTVCYTSAAGSPNNAVPVTPSTSLSQTAGPRDGKPVAPAGGIRRFSHPPSTAGASTQSEAPIFSKGPESARVAPDATAAVFTRCVPRRSASDSNLYLQCPGGSSDDAFPAANGSDTAFGRTSESPPPRRNSVHGVGAPLNPSTPPATAPRVAFHQSSLRANNEGSGSFLVGTKGTAAAGTSSTSTSSVSHSSSPGLIPVANCEQYRNQTMEEGLRDAAPASDVVSSMACWSASPSTPILAPQGPSGTACLKPHQPYAVPHEPSDGALSDSANQQHHGGGFFHIRGCANIHGSPMASGLPTLHPAAVGNDASTPAAHNTGNDAENDNKTQRVRLPRKSYKPTQSRSRTSEVNDQPLPIGSTSNKLPRMSVDASSDVDSQRSLNAAPRKPNSPRRRGTSDRRTLQSDLDETSAASGTESDDSTTTSSTSKSSVSGDSDSDCEQLAVRNTDGEDSFSDFTPEDKRRNSSLLPAVVANRAPQRVVFVSAQRRRSVLNQAATMGLIPRSAALDN